MKKFYSLALLVLMLAGPGAHGAALNGARAALPLPESSQKKKKTRKVKVYLVRVGDNGKSGRKIGCDDSLVAVTRTVPRTSAPLKAAIRELLSIPAEEGNYWRGDNLRLKSASISKGTATIRIRGNGPAVGGVCDEPRIIEQINWTAKQFSNVRRVRVFVNGVPLARAIS